MHRWVLFEAVGIGARGAAEHLGRRVGRLVEARGDLREIAGHGRRMCPGRAVGDQGLAERLEVALEDLELAPNDAGEQLREVGRRVGVVRWWEMMSCVFDRARILHPLKLAGLAGVVKTARKETRSGSRGWPLRYLRISATWFISTFAVYSLTPNANLTSCCSTSTNFRIVGTAWDCFFQRAAISIWPASSASR